MSWRKMSESGWRPAWVTSASSMYLLPSFGPFRTTSSAPPPRKSSGETFRSSSGSRSSTGVTTWVMVVSSASVRLRAAPHDEQKFEPGGLRWPHWLQNTSGKGMSVGLFEEGPVGGGVHQPVEFGRFGHLHGEDPSLAIGVLVDHLRRVAEVGVDLGHGARH